MEGIFWDLFKLRCRGHFDGIDVRKMGSLQNRFDLGKEEKVTGGQIGGMWGVIPKLQCSFRKTDQYSGLRDQERYRDGASMRELPKGSVSCHTLSHKALKNVFKTSFVSNSLPQGQTVNQTVYKDILQRLMRQCVTRGRPFWEAHAWTLHHDNAPDHAALSIGQFFERNIAILE